MDIYMVKTHSFYIAILPKVEGPKGTPYWSSVLKAKEWILFTSVLKYIFNGLEKIYTEIPDRNYLGQYLCQRAWVSQLSSPLAIPKLFK